MAVSATGSGSPRPQVGTAFPPKRNFIVTPRFATYKMGDGRRVATGREKTSSHQEDEWRLQTLARQHGIRKDRETDSIGKLFASFVRRVDEGTLSRLLVEATILLASGTNPTVVLRDALPSTK